MSKIEVFYEDWQYDCCGPYFSVGEYIWWPIEIGNYQKIINNKKRNIKYFCDTHGSKGVDRYISGKVKKIEAISGDKYIECKDTSEIKEMGYSFIVTLDDTEEFFCNDIKDLNSISNPFIKNKILNKKYVYTKINIIGDLNSTALSMTKAFNENHYGINFYYKNKRKYKEYYNELKNIRSYSRNEYYDINIYDITKNKDDFTNALNIIISDKNDYTYFYNFLLKNQENVLNQLSICNVKCKKDSYELNFAFDNLKKTKILFTKKISYSKKIRNLQYSVKTKEELIDFVFDKIYKKIKVINSKRRIIFFIFLWIIIKIITFIVRY